MGERDHAVAFAKRGDFGVQADDAAFAAFYAAYFIEQSEREDERCEKYDEDS